MSKIVKFAEDDLPTVGTAEGHVSAEFQRPVSELPTRRARTRRLSQKGHTFCKRDSETKRMSFVHVHLFKEMPSACHIGEVAVVRDHEEGLML